MEKKESLKVRLKKTDVADLLQYTTMPLWSIYSKDLFPCTIQPFWFLQSTPFLNPFSDFSYHYAVTRSNKVLKTHGQVRSMASSYNVFNTWGVALTIIWGWDILALELICSFNNVCLLEAASSTHTGTCVQGFTK